MDGSLSEEAEAVSLKQHLKRFYAHQEDRVKTYKVFGEVFKAYLQDAPNYDFPTYRTYINEITLKFSNLSHDIREIEDVLRLNGESKLADLIRQVQQQEKAKLELTTKLQLAEQNERDHPEQDNSAEVKDIAARLQSTVAKINELLDDLKYEAEDILLAEDEEEMEGDR
ncbi:predicted protein [Nematostella vectensis]|uniref:Uncharacterized protein n=1 Tax=Nematostella vectensis TaxID=45351 RepID=A7SB57_NEMVE|nr:required for excision 1-B domain-containing protein [Nematostella vectensis]EDO39025.1 predicted protein [Nematostella vectensis]|eukprot:XP_001631088.1 predicted protein [Nematostella vectensis]